MVTLRNNGLGNAESLHITLSNEIDVEGQNREDYELHILESREIGIQYKKKNGVRIDKNS